MLRTKNSLAHVFGCLVLFLSASAGASFWPLEEGEVERALKAPNVHERRAAARRIGALSQSVARKALEQAIGDQDREVRLVGLRTARAFEMDELSPLALESLKSREAAERVEAVRLIALQPDDAQVAALESMASDADPVVRREIAAALGRLPRVYATTASAKLLGMLDDSEVAVRVEVAAALGRLGETSATLALAARLNDPEPEVRVQLALALGAIGAETAIPALQVALLDAQDAVVAAVVTSLGALDSEDAIVSLVAIAEAFPRRSQGEAALEALVRLSKFPAARRHVLDLMESTEHRTALEQVFLRLVPESLPILGECVKSFSSEIALRCAYSLSQNNAGTAAILEAQEQGRLAVSEVLAVLSGVSDRTAIILALERLSLGTAAEFRAAFGYLGSLGELPKEAEGPLIEALTLKGRDAAEVADIARMLGSIRGTTHPKELVSLLAATNDAVSQSASLALVRRGVSGAVLRDLLLGKGSVAAGALEGLGLGATAEQADVLIRLTAEGRSGRRAAFLSVFFAMPASLSDRSLSLLWRIYQGARGAERDALLHPLIGAGKPALWSKLLARASRADRLKVAQLSWYQPRAVVLARRLILDADHEVAALSALSLGRNGSREDAQVLGQIALSTRPHHLRAAAVQGLTFLTERGVKPAISEDLFSDESCGSAHNAYRAQVTRLAATLGRSCGNRTLEDVLTRDLDPRRRRLAAALLRRNSPESPALRTCRFYESRPEVSDECWSKTSSPSDARPASRAPSSELPYRVSEIRSKWHLLTLSPFSVRVPGGELGNTELADFGLRLMTDRAGRVVMPVAAYEPIDPNWFF